MGHIAPLNDEEFDGLTDTRNTPRFRRTRILKAARDTPAAIAISPKRIDISAADSYDSAAPQGISVIGGVGTVIRGPLGFTGTPSDIRFAGIWKMNDVMLSAVPSTILTPVPVLRFSLPSESLVQLFQTVNIFGSFGVF